MARKPTNEELEQRVNELEHQAEKYKRVYETLQESEEKHRLFFENSPVGIIHYDNQGIITDVNEAMVETFGSSRKMLVGLNIEEIPDENYANQVKKSLKGEQGHYKGLYKSHTGRKAAFIKADWIPIKRDGRVVSGVGIVEDISVRKQAGSALQKAHDELEQRVEERTADLTTANEKLQEEIEKRNCVEKSLGKSEEKYRSMMEAMNDPVYICSSGKRISFMNPAMIKRVGYDAKGEFCYKGIHDLEKECPWCTHDKSQQGEKYDDEIISPKDGHFYHVASSPIFHENGSISKMTIYRDITGFKQAKEALQKSEERYRLLTESVADGVVIFQERNFQFVNTALTSIFGYTKDQLTAIDPFTLFRDDHKERFRDLVEKLEKGISVESFQAPCIHSDGREIWVDIHCSIINWTDKPAVLFTFRDITESKLTEFALSNEIEQARKENIKLKSSLKDRYRFGNIIGKSTPMQEIYELILKASRSDDNVVIYGESGTGKELVAQAIHDMSNRYTNNFIIVNCGALPETLIESEFFGYKKGAFTGADLNRHGYLDLADGGTLFLDEVGELGVNMQVKLLRAIEGRGYTPLGCNQTKNSDFRIVAATNKNLFDMTKAGSLRKDFFYRMHVISIDIPPLRDRTEDIPLLSDYFLKLHGNGKKLKTIPGQILETLRSHDWPGNVRELENVLKRYLTLNRLDFIGKDRHQNINEPDILNKSFHEEVERQFETLEKVEQNYIYWALQENNWHRANTAKTLGISERTLYRKLKQLPEKMS